MGPKPRRRAAFGWGRLAGTQVDLGRSGPCRWPGTDPAQPRWGAVEPAVRGLITGPRRAALAAPVTSEGDRRTGLLKRKAMRRKIFTGLRGLKDRHLALGDAGTRSSGTRCRAASARKPSGKEARDSGRRDGPTGRATAQGRGVGVLNRIPLRSPKGQEGTGTVVRRDPRGTTGPAAG